MKKILIIEPTLITVKNISDGVHRLGYEPLILCNKKHYTGDALKHLAAYPHYDVDTADLQKIIYFIHRKKISRIAGVITTADRFLNTSCKLAQILNVKGLDPALLLLTNKANVCKLIPEFSPPTLSFNPTHIPLHNLQELHKKFKPIIFKPALSAGARGMFTLNTLSDSLIRKKIKEEFGTHGADVTWLAQPFFEGTLMSLEGYVSKRKIYFIGYSLREKVGKAETVNHFPANALIPLPLQERMRLAVTALLKRADYKNGYFHCEFIVSNTQCYLIDANIGRIGGSGIGMQIALSHYKNPADVFAHVVDVSLFQGKHYAADFYNGICTKTNFITYGLQRGGKFEKVYFPRTCNFIHIQLLNNGTKVPALSSGADAKIGTVIGFSPTLENELQKIKIYTNKGIVSPYFRNE